MRVPTCVSQPMSLQAAALAVGTAAVLVLGCSQGAQPVAPGQASAPNAWTMFRGDPGLLGVAGGNLPDNLKVLWKFKTDDAVRSTAAIADGRVFIGSDDGNVYALSLKDGSKLWAFKTEGPVQAAPLLLGGTVFIGSSDAILYALDAATGKPRWKYETGDKILGAANWTKSPKGDQTWVLVGSYDSRLHAVNAEDGKPVWTFETGNYINGSPSVGDGKTVFGGCDARIHAVSVADGQQAAEIDTGSYIAGSAAVAGGRAYVGNYGNEFICVDLAAKKIAWAWKDREFAVFSSPAVTADLVLFGSRDKSLHAVRRDTGESAWAFETGGEVDSSPVVCGKKVFVGSGDGKVYLVSLADGKPLWSFEIGAAVGGSPAVASGVVVIGADDGCVYAFGKK